MEHSAADLYHRAAAVVDLACISHNLNVVREKAPGRKIIAMIKAHHDPEEVAHFFFQNIQEPSIATAMANANMQILPAFAPHLMDWLTPSVENQNYVRTVFEKVQEIGPQYGAQFDAATPEEVEEVDEDGDEDGEEEGDAPEDVTPQAAKEKP